MRIDRRQFLILSSVAALGGRVLSAAESGRPGDSSGVPWHQKIKRVGQVNMNERDPV
jgi:hypothetical protein